MTKWQRWARLLVAIFAVGFAVMVALAFKRRAPVAAPGLSGRTDPNAVVESTTGRVMKFSGAREDVTVEYQKQSTYKDGTSNFQGVKVISEERNGKRTFVITAKEASVGANESTITMNGNVTLTASDGLVVRSEHATYTEADGTVRVPGPVEFARKRLSGSGVGMTYDKNQDVLVILDQAHVRIASDAERCRRHGSHVTDGDGGAPRQVPAVRARHQGVARRAGDRGRQRRRPSQRRRGAHRQHRAARQLENHRIQGRRRRAAGAHRPRHGSEIRRRRRNARARPDRRRRGVADCGTGGRGRAARLSPTCST